MQASEGTFFVYRLEDGEPVAVDVELGRSNDALVEIVKGLSDGDRVLLYSPDAAKTKKNGDDAKPAAADKKGE